jgi:hypothetical protein
MLLLTGCWNRSLEWVSVAPAKGDQPLTATDMERLEHAARLSMGGIPDADTPATPPHPIHYVRFIGLALVAAAALAIALGLL